MGSRARPASSSLLLLLALATALLCVPSRGEISELLTSSLKKIDQVEQLFQQWTEEMKLLKQQSLEWQSTRVDQLKRLEEQQLQNKEMHATLQKFALQMESESRATQVLHSRIRSSMSSSSILHDEGESGVDLSRQVDQAIEVLLTQLSKQIKEKHDLGDFERKLRQKLTTVKQDMENPKKHPFFCPNGCYVWEKMGLQESTLRELGISSTELKNIKFFQEESSIVSLPPLSSDLRVAASEAEAAFLQLNGRLTRTGTSNLKDLMEALNLAQRHISQAQSQFVLEAQAFATLENQKKEDQQEQEHLLQELNNALEESEDLKQQLERFTDKKEGTGVLNVAEKGLNIMGKVAGQLDQLDLGTHKVQVDNLVAALTDIYAALHKGGCYVFNCYKHINFDLRLDS